MSFETPASSSEARLETAANRLEKMVETLTAGDRQGSLKESLGGGAVTDGESTDLAAAMTDMFTADTLASVLESRRSQALHALERLRSGLYGICEDCGQPIAGERLEYQPEATRCIRCQGRWERGTAVGAD